MATNKHIDKLCLIAALLALLLALGFLYGKQQGPSGGGKTMGYEARLFDTTTVHTIDLQMEDWEDFIASCEDETYHPCTVVIDGEAYANIGIRAKGNLCAPSPPWSASAIALSWSSTSTTVACTITAWISSA